MVEGKTFNLNHNLEWFVKEVPYLICPFRKTARWRNEILSFKKKAEKNHYYAWERFSICSKIDHITNKKQVISSYFC